MSGDAIWMSSAGTSRTERHLIETVTGLVLFGVLLLLLLLRMRLMLQEDARQRLPLPS